MPTPAKGARLGGSPAHERLILSNLATQLFEHGRIITTEAKARRLRPVAEKLITKAKRGDIHARRQVLTTVRDKGVVHELFTEIAPGFADREGGYTRITKVGPRKGDNAPMAMIELVTESLEDSRKAKAGTTTSAPRTGSSTRPAPTAAPAAPAAAPAATAPTADDEGSGDQADTEPTQPAPAEELVEETEEREATTGNQEAPSDDTSTEEAEAIQEEGPAAGRS